MLKRSPQNITCPTCKQPARRWTRRVTSVENLRYVCTSCIPAKILNASGATVYTAGDDAS